jgi:hypothetical protein
VAGIQEPAHQLERHTVHVAQPGDRLGGLLGQAQRDAGVGAALCLRQDVGGKLRGIVGDACRSLFEPSGVGSRSITSGDSPASATASAAVSPVPPAPTITTGTCMSLINASS